MKSIVIRKEAPVKEIILTLTPEEFEMVYMALDQADTNLIPGHIPLWNQVCELRNSL